MEGSYGPYFDPDFDDHNDRINPPRVCIDNDTCEDCTLVKVDSATRHGILLEMVQVLTDLDLVISKSYISSDGGWLMDVFHVTDHLGNKLTEDALVSYIQQSLAPGRRGAAGPGEVRTCLGNLVGPGLLAPSEHAALELTATDRPGLLSEISAVLAQLGCHVASIHAWTHNSRAAAILYLSGDDEEQQPPAEGRLAHIAEQVDSVVAAHQGPGERRAVRVSGPAPGRVHTERRLHQLMREDRDYEPPPTPTTTTTKPPSSKAAASETRVSIESWQEKGYSVASVRSRDRPKLLFDTVCTLTDMQYVVFHAAISSQGPLAIQEYYIRHVDGCTLDTEAERQRVTRCLVAAVERRVSHGLRLDVLTKNRAGLLSDVTRAFRENGLSLTRAECTTRGERAMGTFYVTDASGGEIDLKSVEAVREDLGGSVTLKVNSSTGWPPIGKGNTARPAGGRRRSTDDVREDRQKVSLGSILWSQIERFSSNFGSIRS